jgi:hypothetical protein
MVSSIDREVPEVRHSNHRVQTMIERFLAPLFSVVTLLIILAACSEAPKKEANLRKIGAEVYCLEKTLQAPSSSTI